MASLEEVFPNFTTTIIENKQYICSHCNETKDILVSDDDNTHILCGKCNKKTYRPYYYGKKSIKNN